MYKILHIVREGYPFLCGYVLRTENLLNNIDHNVYKIDVVSSIFSNSLEQLKQGNHFIHNKRKYYNMLSKRIFIINQIFKKIPFIRFVAQYIYIIINTCKICVNINIDAYDVIHGHSTFLNGVSAMILAKCFNKPFVYDVHAVDFEKLDKNIIKRKLENFFETMIINNADAIIAIDQLLKQKIIKKINTIDQKKIYVAPNGVDNNFFRKVQISNIKNQFKVGIDKSKILENFSFIYNNMEKINEKIPNIHFYVIGDKEGLKSNEWMTFLNGISFNKMPDYYSQLDLFIIPRVKNYQTKSITPLKVLEAMSCETPVLISDVKGLTCCIENNSTGYIYRNDDIDDFINVLYHIVHNNNRVKIGKAARSWILNNRDWSISARVYETVYKNVLKIL